MPERTEVPVGNEMPMPDPDLGFNPVRTDAERERAAREKELAESRKRRAEAERSRRLRWILVVAGCLAVAALTFGAWRLYGLAGALVGLEPISVYALLHLWRRPDSVRWKRIVWTPAILVPLFGPIAYGALHTPPPPNDPGSGQRGGVFGST